MSAGAAALAFNLLCAGTLTTHFQPVAPTVAKYEETFRLDLSTKRWCSNECKETRAIISISEAEIVLDRDTSTGFDNFEKINRESGRHTYMLRIENFSGTKFPVIAMKEGACTASSFSGFPTPKF